MIPNLFLKALTTFPEIGPKLIRTKKGNKSTQILMAIGGSPKTIRL